MLDKVAVLKDQRAQLESAHYLGSLRVQILQADATLGERERQWQLDAQERTLASYRSAIGVVDGQLLSLGAVVDNKVAACSDVTSAPVTQA